MSSSKDHEFLRYPGARLLPPNTIYALLLSFGSPSNYSKHIWWDLFQNIVLCVNISCTPTSLVSDAESLSQLGGTFNVTEHFTYFSKSGEVEIIKSILKGKLQMIGAG